MKPVTIILLIIATLVLLGLINCAHIGLFSHVTVIERNEGGFKVVGMEYTGPYSKSGKFMMEVDKKLKDMGVECSKGFGIYYDDPKTTPAEKCRSFVGGILEEKDFNRIAELQSKGFKVDSVPLAQAAVVEFPIKSMVSYMVGPMKAYPALSKYMSEKNYKHVLSLEVYDVPNKQIFYIMQYAKS